MNLFFLKTFTQITIKIIKLFKLGNGYTFPGYFILKFFPNILSSKTFNYKKGIILISGTNGKTTTSKLVTDILKGNGFKVAHNASGSNLLRGIVTCLFLDLNFFGKPSSDIAVLEVDEFALPQVLDNLTPKVLVLLNLSRDQLDRYGETDTILSRWINSLQNLSTKTTLVLDATQPVLSILKDIFKGTTESFNSFAPHGIHVKEAFNIKNVNASLKVCSLYKLNLENCKNIINNFQYAYGRGEQIVYKDIPFTIYLAKNPASFTNNLETLIDTPTFNSLLFILNDNIPDGRDVSWIYDVDTDLLKTFYNKVGVSSENIFISGTRCYDLASRLSYAGFEISKDNVNKDLKKTLNLIESKKLKNSSFAVLPNYSAMLAFRKLTLGRSIL